MVNAMGQPEFYVIPADLVEEIVKIINKLPYGQVAPLATRLGKIVIDTNEQARMNNAKKIAPKAQEGGQGQGVNRKAG